MLRLSAIVVHYRTPHLLPACVAALSECDEVVLADNSADGSALPATPAIVRTAPARGGFGAGANLGARAATGDLLLFVNPDTTVQPGTAAAIRTAFGDEPGLGVLGCRDIGADGPALANGRRFYTPLAVATRRFLPRSGPSRRHVIADWDRSTDRPVDFVSGYALAIRRELFERLGGFDERYFMYFEDADLCLSAWRSGAEVWVKAAATVTHTAARRSASGANRALWWHVRSYWRFLHKWRLAGLFPTPHGDRAAQRSSIVARQ